MIPAPALIPGGASGRGSRLFPRLLPALLLAFATACSESLESSSGCPLLCPNQNLDVKEVELDAVEFDATIAPIPPIGDAQFFTLARSGDSLDSRVVIRFDSLPISYTLGGVTTPVTAVDSTHLRIFVDTAASLLKDNATIDVYDVETSAADTDFGALTPLFTQERLLGSLVVLPGVLPDTIDIPLSNAALLARIQSPVRRMRVGLRVRSDSTVRIVMRTANQTFFPRLRYDPAPDNTVQNVLERPPRSYTPAGDIDLATDLTDFSLAVAGPVPLRRLTTGSDTIGVYRDSLIAVGGVGLRRIYLRFNLPDSILNTTIIRATLILHKKASPDYGSRDSIPIVPQAVLSTFAIPPSRAVLVTDTLRVFPMPSVRLEPRDAGPVQFNIANFARTWTVASREQFPHAISLRVGQETRVMQEMVFYSTSGPAQFRPRVRITYVPRQAIGRP